MARRIFQDRDIWDDAWHIELPLEAKLLWNYLGCSCNQAGFLKWSPKIASFKTGIPQERVDSILQILIDSKDIDGPKLYYRQGIIYVHTHIFLQDPNGLSVTNTAHSGILKSLFLHIEVFPECLVHFPDSHRAMKKTIEDYIKQGGPKNKEAAMRSLLNELNKVTPAKLTPAREEQLQLLPEAEPPALIKECLRRLSAVPGYPLDYKKDAQFLMDMLAEYGDRGFLHALKGKIAWWMDDPIKKSSKPRSQLRNWFQNHFVNFPERDRAEARAKAEEGRKKIREHQEAQKKREQEARRKQKEELEKLKAEEKWLDEHLEAEDIEAVMKKMEAQGDDGRAIVIDFMNKRRQSKGMKPLKGGQEE